MASQGMIVGRVPAWAKGSDGHGYGSGDGSGDGYGYGSGDGPFTHDPRLLKLPIAQVELVHFVENQTAHYVQEKYEGDWWCDGDALVRPRAAHEPLTLPGLERLSADEAATWATKGAA